MENLLLFKNQKKILICLTLYITSLFAANSLGIKIMPFIFGSHLSVGIFSFPIVFIMTDVIGEVYGKKVSKLFILSGIISIILFTFYSLISVIVPWAKEGLWVKDSYNQIFGITARVSIASLLAFVVAEYQDVFSFFFLKRKLNDKYFWLRSNLSNLWSQLFDSIIFMFVAFLGIYPLKTIILIVIPWWLFKVLMGFAYTPLSYLGIYLLKGRSVKDGKNI
ncbi:MAG: queuosine precursor transporter [Candidatus Paceibacterota bacterium]|jgi:hypothetical protein